MIVNAAKPGQNGGKARPKKAWDLRLGGSSGRGDDVLSASLQELMKNMPSILEVNRIEGALNGPDGWEKVGVLVGRTSSSMLLTTEQLAEAIPPVYKSLEGTLIKLKLDDPDERTPAIRAEAEVPESEFYGLHLRSERDPGTMGRRRQG